MGMRSKLLIIIAIISITTSVSGDEWRFPEAKKYFSNNGSFYFEVKPKNLTQSEGENNFCVGTLYRFKNGLSDEKIWTRRLVNDVSPVSALVTDDSKFVVTFDNWGSAGYGDDVVAIYGENGDLVRKYALDVIISSEEIDQNVAHSVSSRWWGGNHRFDENNRLLILKIVINRKMPTEKEAQFREVHMSLQDGKIINIKNE